ncbi:MAG: hypothetical protein WDW38_002536 [Sanguina aurantia]
MKRPPGFQQPCTARSDGKSHMGRHKLWTEMVVDLTVIHSPALDKHLWFPPEQHPIVLQLGGSDPDNLRKAAAIAKQYGYDEVNLNCGCPSDRVAGAGCFGAAMMLQPETVARCMAAIAESLGPSTPVNVKCRLGVDEHDSYQALCDFVRVVSAHSPARHFIVHSRKCFLAGLSPTQNRSVPPLRHDWAWALAEDFPHLDFSLNGGISGCYEAEAAIRSLPGQPAAPGTANGGHSHAAHASNGSSAGVAAAAVTADAVTGTTAEALASVSHEAPPAHATAEHAATHPSVSAPLSSEPTAAAAAAGRTSASSSGRRRFSAGTWTTAAATAAAAAALLQPQRLLSPIIQPRYSQQPKQQQQQQEHSIPARRHLPRWSTPCTPSSGSTRSCSSIAGTCRRSVGSSRGCRGASRGVMIGRAAYNDPWSTLSDADRAVFGEATNPAVSRRQVLKDYGRYADAMVGRWHVKDDGHRDPSVRTLLRPILNLFHGEQNCKKWKAGVDEVLKLGVGADGSAPWVNKEPPSVSCVLDATLHLLPDDVLDAPPRQVRHHLPTFTLPRVRPSGRSGAGLDDRSDAAIAQKAAKKAGRGKAAAKMERKKENKRKRLADAADADAAAPAEMGEGEAEQEGEGRRWLGQWCRCWQRL